MSYASEYIASRVAKMSARALVVNRRDTQSSDALLLSIKDRVARVYSFDTDAFYYSVGLAKKVAESLIDRITVLLNNIQKYTIASVAATGVASSVTGMSAAFFIEKLADESSKSGRTLTIAQLAETAKVYAASFKGADGVPLVAAPPARAKELLSDELLQLERSMTKLFTLLRYLQNAEAYFVAAKFHDVLVTSTAASALDVVQGHAQAGALHTQEATLDVMAASGMLSLHAEPVDVRKPKYRGSLASTNDVKPSVTISSSSAVYSRATIRPGDYVLATDTLTHIATVTQVISNVEFRIAKTGAYYLAASVDIISPGQSTLPKLVTAAQEILSRDGSLFSVGYVSDAAWLYAKANTGLPKYMSAHNSLLAALAQWRSALSAYAFNKVASVDKLLDFLRDERLGSVADVLLELQFHKVAELSPGDLSEQESMEGLLEDLASTLGGEDIDQGVSVGEDGYSGYTLRPGNSLSATLGTALK